MKKTLTKLMFFMVFVLSVSATYAQRMVTGKVKDSKTGEALIGASVLVKGTTTGTITDIDGSYSLNAPVGSTLVVSYTGYPEMEMLVSETGNMDFSVEPGSVLEEVVVTGYGTVKKKDATGSVASISTRDFQKGIVLSTDQMMQGRVAGVQISQNSGEPGGGINVRIRGTSSVYGGNQPLFVVDGVPLSGDETSAGASAFGVGRQSAKNPLNFLNPDDIASIDVLKDASATAIYGARGANGVVMVTTKKGKGKGSLSYGYSMGMSTITKKYDLFSATEYVAAGGQNTGSATDWQEELFRTGVTNQHNISYGGGDQSSNYRFSAGYINQNGIVLNSAAKRYSAGFNGSKSFASDRIKIASSLNMSNSLDANVPISENVGFTGDLMGNILKFNPTNPIYDVKDIDGDKDVKEFYQPGVTEVNPLAFVNLSKDNTNTLRALGNISAEINLFKGLNFKNVLGFDKSLSNRKSGYSKDLIIEATKEVGRTYYRDINTNNNLWESYLTYDKEFGSISFNGLAGYSYQTFENENKNASAAKFSTGDVEEMINNVGNAELSVINNTSSTLDELQSYFGRVNLGISDKYLLTATLRADGSSKFAENFKYGYFPSFAFKWKLINEDFIGKGLFSDLGLRLGYGVTGNQSIPHNLYERRDRFGDRNINFDANKIEGGGTSAVTFNNPNLKWESTASLNVGLDFGLGDKLRGTLDVYQKNTKDLLFLVVSAQPAPTPFSWKNLDTDIQNRGVELGLNYDITSTQDFGWDVSLNGAYNKNLVKNLKGVYDTGEINGQGLSGAFAQRISEGQPLFAFFLREFGGYDEAGNTIYPNGDVQQFLDGGKSPLPTLTGGLTNNIRYKGFDASIFFNAVAGNYIYSNTANAFFTKGSFSNGRNTTKDIATIKEGPLNAPDVSTRFLEKGDFVRLQNLSLGYKVPISNNKFVENIRLFIAGQNLLTFTGYSGQDPEVSTNKSLNGIPSFGIDYTAYPRAKTWTVGANVTF
jgi:TonB-dependent starch-binding outer membrane protein SusC